MKNLSLFAIVFVAGCSTMGSNQTPMGTSYVPVVDMQGHSGVQFQADQQECLAYANESLSYAKQHAAAAQPSSSFMNGLFVGLFVGLLTPEKYRYQTDYQTDFAPTQSGVKLYVSESQQTLIKQCLTARGYTVLN
jgi:hypothetical protein